MAPRSGVGMVSEIEKLDRQALIQQGSTCGQPTSSETVETR